MIWHIFRKDLRMSWKPALGAAVLQWIATALIVRLGIFPANRTLEQVHSLVRVTAGLATFLAAIVAVQNDVLTLPTGDWLMRPIRHRDMLLAKILFFIAAVQLPILIGCVAEGMGFGFGFGDSFGTALWQAAMMTLGMGIPAVALGAMTANLVEAIVFVISVVAIAVGQSWLAETLDSSSRSGLLFNLDWIEGAGLTGGMFVGGTIALWVLYRWRKVAQARYASAAIFIVGAAIGLLPWKSAFAVQGWITPPSGAARNIRLEFDAAARNPRAVAAFGDTADVPVRVAGLEAGTAVRADLIEVTLTGADGSVEHPQIRPSQLSKVGRGALRIVSGASSPVTVKADYWLTLVREAGHQWVETGDRETPVPGLGRCRIGVMSENWGETVGCVSAGPANGVCYSLGDDRFSSVFCQNYGPSWLWFPDWDELSRIPSGAIPIRGIPRRVDVTTYKIVEHFVRHLEIPDVRLDNWRPKG
ncbi:MAG TPA: hypothetical protein VN519_09535 [Bryobacteraceae bacterium]|nr:hypothetical protein [Bryobacteraceae bacterium]